MLKWCQFLSKTYENECSLFFRWKISSHKLGQLDLDVVSSKRLLQVQQKLRILPSVEVGDQNGSSSHQSWASASGSTRVIRWDVITGAFWTAIKYLERVMCLAWSSWLNVIPDSIKVEIACPSVSSLHHLLHWQDLNICFYGVTVFTALEKMSFSFEIII